MIGTIYIEPGDEGHVRIRCNSQVLRLTVKEAQEGFREGVFDLTDYVDGTTNLLRIKTSRGWLEYPLDPSTRSQIAQALRDPNGPGPCAFRLVRLEGAAEVEVERLREELRRAREEGAKGLRTIKQLQERIVSQAGRLATYAGEVERTRERFEGLRQVNEAMRTANRSLRATLTKVHVVLEQLQADERRIRRDPDAFELGSKAVFSWVRERLEEALKEESEAPPGPCPQGEDETYYEGGD